MRESPSHSPNRAALFNLNRGCALSYYNLICLRSLVSMGGFPFSEEKGRGNRGRGIEGEGVVEEEEGKL